MPNKNNDEEDYALLIKSTAKPLNQLPNNVCDNNNNKILEELKGFLESANIITNLDHIEFGIEMWKDGAKFSSLMKYMNKDGCAAHVVKMNINLDKYAKLKNKDPDFHTRTFFGSIMFYFEIDDYVYAVISFHNTCKDIICNDSFVYLTPSSMNKKIGIVDVECIETMVGLLKYNGQHKYIFWPGMKVKRSTFENIGNINEL